MTHFYHADSNSANVDVPTHALLSNCKIRNPLGDRVRDPLALLLVLPFLPLSLTERAIGAAGLVVMAEVMFWVGAVLAGHEVVRRFRQKLNPKALWKRMGDRVQ